MEKLRLNKIRMRIVVSGLAVLAVVLALSDTHPRETYSASLKRQQELQVIGHRGAAGLAPENTLAAFRKALALRVDGLEMDVLLTADGEVVVHHDFALKPETTRTPDGKWIKGSSAPLIKDLTLSQLRTYDVGRLQPYTLYSRRYPDQQPADGERIPTLGEVLSLLRSGGQDKTTLWIEVKTSPERTDATPAPEKVVEAVIKVLQEGDFSPRTLFLSFDWRALAHARKRAPQVPAVYLSLVSSGLDNIKPGRPGPSPWTAGIDVDDFQGSIPRAVNAAGGKYWGPHYKSITSELVEEAHHLGIRVYPWTVDDRNAMIRLMDMGVDGIITNRPDIFMSLFNAR
jgi:glycerophosphoryl diester phosphodiesterase